jgi:Zn-dependent protease with chaperone function
MRILLPALAVLSGCVTSEYTGRRQLMLVDEKTEAQLGRQAYQEALAEQKISHDPALVEPVRRVGRRIAEAARQPEFEWEFNVIEDPKTVNAWCLPGGKIAFYTGIYPVLRDEAGMAFVMGHEVAHALLHHGAERMSQNLLAGGASALLNAYLGARHPEHQRLAMAAFGMGVGVGVLLPYSRKHESEADRLGLELMARAGYDPAASVDVWKRMAEAGGAQPPEFLSTHPSHETRIRDLEDHLKEAQALYRGADPAPVARLPAPAGADGRRARPPGAAAGLAVQGGGPRRETREDGRPVLLLPVAFDQDVFLDHVEVRGPGGAAASVDVKRGIPARASRFVSFSGPGAPEPGRYLATFRGTASGRPFVATRAYDLR